MASFCSWKLVFFPIKHQTRQKKKHKDFTLNLYCFIVLDKSLLLCEILFRLCKHLRADVAIDQVHMVNLSVLVHFGFLNVPLFPDVLFQRYK